MKTLSKTVGLHFRITTDRNLHNILSPSHSQSFGCRYIRFNFLFLLLQMEQLALLSIAIRRTMFDFSNCYQFFMDFHTHTHTHHPSLEMRFARSEIDERVHNGRDRVYINEILKLFVDDDDDEFGNRLQLSFFRLFIYLSCVHWVGDIIVSFDNESRNPYHRATHSHHNGWRILTLRTKSAHNVCVRVFGVTASAYIKCTKNNVLRAIHFPLSMNEKMYQKLIINVQFPLELIGPIDNWRAHVGSERIFVSTVILFWITFIADFNCFRSEKCRFQLRCERRSRDCFKPRLNHTSDRSLLFTFSFDKHLWMSATWTRHGFLVVFMFLSQKIGAGVSVDRRISQIDCIYE